MCSRSVIGKFNHFCRTQSRSFLRFKYSAGQLNKQGKTCLENSRVFYLHTYGYAMKTPLSRIDYPAAVVCSSPTALCSSRFAGEEHLRKWKRTDTFSFISINWAFSEVLFQLNVKTCSLLSSTLSANHSPKPAGVDRNSNRMLGEHLTGYSRVYNYFLLIKLLLPAKGLFSIILN